MRTWSLTPLQYYTENGNANSIYSVKSKSKLMLSDVSSIIIKASKRRNVGHISFYFCADFFSSVTATSYTKFKLF